ncbi:hypothetical protein JHK85_013212 [Glycine max]|nr:hypothetical protein JHK85_013212 [Glycine max]KAG5057874.1 hypothetical protein JHK86_012870 [Glycine max]
MSRYNLIRGVLLLFGSHNGAATIDDSPFRASTRLTQAASSTTPLASMTTSVALKMPGITIGDTIPDLQVETNQGKINLHQFCADGWTILFSHPGDFTPVCTTELGKMAQYAKEFYQRGVKLLGLSCDDVQSHNEWIKDIEAYTIKLSFLYPATTGRNMDEVLRVIESLQKASKFKVATPANWKPGDPVVISPGVTNEQAKEMFPKGFETVDLPSKKEYLRLTKV